MYSLLFCILDNDTDSLYLGLYSFNETWIPRVYSGYPRIPFPLSKMVKCFCTTSGCRDQGGVDVDNRTFKSHSVKDKAQLAQKASEAAIHAVEEEVNVIASHLASHTLADKVSGLPSIPAGRLWSKWTAELPEPVDVTATYSPSRRELLQNILSQLSKFDLSTKILHEKVTLELQTSDSPSFLNSPTFPLNHLHLERLGLEANIEKIKSKAASVTVFKESIKQQLLLISKTLHSTKTKWKNHQVSSHFTAPPAGLKHSTGNYLLQV